MHLQLECYLSPIGEIILVSDERGALRSLDFADYRARMERLLRAHYGSYQIEESPNRYGHGAALDAYFAGDLSAFDGGQFATGGTAFQRDVWSALREIPAGTTVSYGALATRMGRPGSARAVGTANRENPIGIVVPCHRVIGANGQLTGYAGGLERKRWLLAHEAKWAHPAQLAEKPGAMTSKKHSGLTTPSPAHHA